MPKKALQFVPKMNGRSSILSDVMISNFISYLPKYMQLNRWDLLFKMENDGCSFITFFSKLREVEQTVLVVRDHNGYVFGCFCREPWRVSYTFFGDSDNTLFSFGKEEDPKFYYWSGQGEHFMYSNDDSIGVGGSKRKGVFALYLHSDFRRGSSVNTEMFENECLASTQDFYCNALEVWAIVD